MDLIFYKKIPKHGSIFPKLKIVKNWPIFQEKSVKMGNFFAKMFLKDGYEGLSITLPSKSKFEYPPPPVPDVASYSQHFGTISK